MRALAALAILVLHAYSYTALTTMGEGRRGEYASVVGETFDTILLQSAVRTNVFFVLSGLLLALPFIRWLLVPGERRPSLRRFTRNRVRRIWPLYLVVMLFAAATITVDFAGLRNVVLNALLVVNLVPETPRLLPVAWTLYVELGFYVLLPVGMFLLAPVVRRLPWLWLRALVVAALPAAGFWVGIWARSHPQYRYRDVDLRTTVLGHADDFAMGMLVAIVVIAALASHGRVAHAVRALPPFAWTIPGSVAVFFALRARWQGVEAGQGVDMHAWWPSLAAVGIGGWLLGMSLRPDRSWLGRIMASPVLHSLGLRSYGIFLWHFVVIRLLHQQGLLVAGGMGAVAANVGIVLAITLPLAWLSWHLVEKPFLDGRVTLPRLRPAWREFVRAPARQRPVMLVSAEAAADAGALPGTADRREW
ncbi:MAG: putative acyltransferase [Thermoleophilia bacterium]|nr:putative acyltransferase [Thermoleophilia bacterium]